MAQDRQEERPDPFSAVMGQSQVSRFLAQAQEEGRLSQAYLFVGPVGSGKTEMAAALAKALLCPSGGCGTCDTCMRIQRSTHPDVHWIEPEGVSTYRVEQIQQLKSDAAQTPIRANRKIFIITRAELLNSNSANAFLKTLEEPLPDTSFVLMARSRDGVLPTLASRCQTLTFRRIPDEEALGLVRRETGADEQNARIALSVSGGSTKVACEFLSSQSQRQLRKTVTSVLERLPSMDAGDVVDAAKRILDSIDALSGEVKSRYSAEKEKNDEFMSRGALKRIDDQQKRAIGSLKRKGLTEAFTVIRSWLRDCAAVAFGSRETMVNSDCNYTIESVANTMSAQSFVTAEQAVDKAAHRVDSNVTPQLVLETMLFDIRKVFHDSGSSH